MEWGAVPGAGMGGQSGPAAGDQGRNGCINSVDIAIFPATPYPEGMKKSLLMLAAFALLTATSGVLAAGTGTVPTKPPVVKNDPCAEC
ncbi:hypothetical protein GCM10008959_25790 [Deinococcus seoulensis]|uniref:Uncharacterized protein n=1 Tax=Deinococcus seoulensis TaxID=1837379 RepID=A0ABQ2RV37_9DEIO|nr:hypothetical protein GCM10008959_25790 [Deinococcus seoulensis]